MNDPLTKTYFEMIERIIDSDGVYPHQGLVLKKGDKLEMHSLAVNVPELVAHFWNQLGDAEEVIYGIDMSTRPGQGTRYADALVIAHWTSSPGKDLADPSCLRVGVINYQNEPRIVDPIDWNNSHWDHWVRSVFPQYRPQFLIRTLKAASASCADEDSE
jgi:hypothetical protein